jgi:hypothetical protein
MPLFYRPPGSYVQPIAKTRAGPLTPGDSP